MIFGRRKFSRHHRWAVVLILPHGELGEIRTPLTRFRRRIDAVRACPEVGRRPEVIRAIVADAGRLEIRRVDRLGFVV